MNSIGFANFRKFESFAPLEYGGITLLVGRNNSGKTTLVKALLLLDHYYKSQVPWKFSFGNQVLEDANIVTYGRAKYHFAKEDYIFFNQRIENYSVSLVISGKDDSSFANVETFIIEDEQEGLVFTFDFPSMTVSINKTVGKEAFENQLKPRVELNIRIEALKEQREKSGLKKTSKDYIDLTDKIRSLEKKIEDLDETESAKLLDLFVIEGDFKKSSSLLNIVQNVLSQSMLKYERELQNISDGNEPSETFEYLRALKEYDPVFVESSFSHFSALMNDYSIVYMGANPVKQSALFAIRDKNNALAQAINEFMQLRIINGDDEFLIVKKWMKEFEVGESFEIKMHANEAYELKIRTQDGLIDLADMGMGSIQAMLLIMRIACTIRKIKNAENNDSKYRIVSKTTVLIEEPELNLHPALQSKLADFFLSIYSDYGICFIVETHSEYLIRKTQLFVKECDFEVPPNENPFHVYYFDQDMKYWKMRFRKDGVFIDNFGSGFFDIASQHAVQLLKRKE